MKFIDFLSNNYLLFIIITVLLLFALIGYFVKNKKNEKTPFKIKNSESDNISNISMDMSLQDMLNNNNKK